VRLSEHVVRFGRLLRSAGLPVGPDRIIDALKAVEVAGIQRRDDLFWALASVLLNKREQFELFQQAFDLYWQQAQPLGAPLLSPALTTAADEDADDIAARLAEALAASWPERPAAILQRKPEAALGASAKEALREMDFRTMTGEELNQARRLMANLRLPIPQVRVRRLRPDPRGPRIDLRGTLRASLRGSADVIPLRRRAQRHEHPPLVVLCDISGSMSRYSRMFLHFLHAITNDRDRVHTFLFGTRLTNITRHLRHRDVDVSLSQVARAVADWSGGTRIGAALTEFNLRWSRRVLGHNAMVLLISDGLDRDAGAGLSEAIERLHKSCRRLIWLNPLLRYEGFEPVATGVRAMLPHVDAFLPAHSVESLTDLGRALVPVRLTSPLRRR
jgi:uncharacterized protein with von Willebrand factor type A (vWA) domain